MIFPVVRRRGESDITRRVRWYQSHADKPMALLTIYQLPYFGRLVPSEANTSVHKKKLQGLDMQLQQKD